MYNSDSMKEYVITGMMEDGSKSYLSSLPIMNCDEYKKGESY